MLKTALAVLAVLALASGAIARPGDAAHPIVLRMQRVQAATDWYESPAYQAVVGERLAATEGRAIIVEGLSSPPP